MARYRIIIDLDTTDPDVGADDIRRAAAAAETVIAQHLGTGAWVDLDRVEELGT